MAPVAQTSAKTPFPSHVLRGDITKMQPMVDDKPKGLNVSGRSWKVRTQERASKLVTAIPQNKRNKTWEKRQAEKSLKKAAKEMEQELKDQTKQLVLDKKERRLQQEKRRMENEFKNAQKNAQALNHKHMHLKLKAMNKKQLRQIKKTRMNSKTGVVEYVGAYAR
jgi:rRNA-processing protein CGR1